MIDVVDGRPRRRRIGLISDTHGLLRPQARSFLVGCDHIIHAGDIGHSGILDELAAIAPLTAVRGNNDGGPWAQRLPLVVDISIGGARIRVIHILEDLADPRQVAEVADAAHAPGVEDGVQLDGPVRVVVSGHSHKPLVQERNGILYVNPGSAGPRRFKLPIAIGELLIEESSVSARLVEL